MRFVPAAEMFPRSSAFGGSCTLNRDLSDGLALRIVDGKYEARGEPRQLAYTQLTYENPNVTVSISWFPTVEECISEYDKGKATYETHGESEPLDESYGVPGYRFDRGCVFRYGNLGVMPLLYDQKHEEKIVTALIEHFESVALTEFPF